MITVDFDTDIRRSGKGTVLLSPTASIRAGEAGRRAYFSVGGRDDDIPELTETFRLTLTPKSPLPTGVTLSRRTAIGTITDNDNAQVVGFVASNSDSLDRSAPEGGAFNYRVGVRRADGAVGRINLIWTATDGTASVADDLAPNSTTGMISISPGTRFADFTINTNDDMLVEGNENFTVTLTADGMLPDTVLLDLAFSRSTATIIDNDNDSFAPLLGTLPLLLEP